MKMKISIATLCILSLGALVHALQESCTIDNCNDCIDYLPQCDVCPARTAKTDDLITCVDCPDNCAVCSAPTVAALECTECDSSYFLVDGACEQCDTNCDVCESATACQTCDEGYFVNADSGCTSCITRCKSCSNDESCSTCDDDAYMDGDTCKACPTNSLTCELQDDVVKIKSCRDDYVIDEDSENCLRCPTECTACSNELNTGNDAKCTACDVTYFEDGDNCPSCTAYCDECEDADTCVTCSEGYALKDDAIDTCQACTLSNCIDCTVNENGEVCTDCKAGYYAAAGVCVGCGVTDCINCDSDTTCTTCKTGWAVGTNGGVVCKQLPANCNTIDAVTDSGDTTCTACDAGYGLNAGACSPCDIADCVACLTAYDTACTACVSGKGPQTDDNDALLCMVLPDNCVLLDADAGSATAVCEECEDGFIVDTGACVDCEVSNSKSCTITDGAVTAVVCKDGYYEDSLTCNRCVDDCAECTDGDTCTECEAGYGLTSEDLCEACTDPCLDCGDDVSVCEDCGDDYVIDDDGGCQPCPDNCDDCDWTDGAAVCTDCAVTFTIDADGECVACPNLCDECSYVTVDDDEVLSCDDCSTGYGVNTYICGDCPSKCETCSYQNNVGMVCSECESQWTVKDGLCIACPSNCLECSSNGVCSDCKSGYGLSFDKLSCVACSELTFENCAFCTDHPDYENDTASCLACNSGFYLRDGLGNGTDAECLSRSEIDSGLTCDSSNVLDEPPTCQEDECAAGYVLFDGLCTKPCFRCGDLRIDATVDPTTCITDNSSDAVQINYCANQGGACMAVRETINSVDMVMTGCVPDGKTCAEGCQDVTRDGVTVQVCTACCVGQLCNNEANIPESYSSATCLSGSALLLLAVAALLQRL